ncbi:transcription elongation factor [Vibrio methylphosphonaticus]|uniref:transcription elongation factor n=1 Tax=Vibrio methylphosphonaticus TaxID=2946866 RepID=UPI00202A7F10|nr:transcription elongation factor [Vibrio methylphosphonaticus]MCL9773158.1 transcription elongation factor [Vibrio methylphosphonaticus]
MNKAAVVQQVIVELEQKIATLLSAMEQTVDAATNEETIPDNKYDTLALEAAYLAHGQAMRLEAIKKDIASLRHLVIRTFEHDSPVGLSAMVDLEDEQEVLSRFFLLPCGGGVSIDTEGLRVVTPESPLGRALVGKRLDDEIALQVGERVTHHVIVNIV